MSKRIIIIGLLILLVFPKIWAQEKMPTALAPMGALGAFSDMEKQIIFNSLQEA